jgi:hypothetical protein
MIPVGTLLIVQKTEVDRKGTKIGAAKRIDQGFQARSGAMPIFIHAYIIDSQKFPHQ